MARVVFEAVRPPVVPKTSPLAGHGEAVLTPPGPKDRGSEPEASKPTETTPSTSQPCLQVPEPGSTASDTNSGKAEEIAPEEVPPPQSLKVRLPLGLLKRRHETVASGSKDGATPSKVRKEPEAEESETAWSTGPSKADLSKACFMLYQKDRPEVQDIWAWILELDDRDDITQEVLDSSLTFRLRRAADESHSCTHQEPHSYGSEEQQIEELSPRSVPIWTADRGGHSSLPVGPWISHRPRQLSCL